MTSIQLLDTQLRDLLQPVIPMASTDKTLPILNSVLIETRGGYLTATTTDRFIVGASRVPASGAKDVRIVIPLAAAKRMLSTFRPRKGRTRTVDVKFFKEAVSVAGQVEGGTVEILAQQVPGDYPPVVDRILRQALTREAAAFTSLNPGKIAQFQKASQHNEPMRLTTDKDSTAKPVLVQIGEDFRGLIMPVRHDGVGPETDPWTAMLEAK